nr:ribosome biogenesis GTP-binding protein YihA/YsxC [Peptostreptococcus faecalis]
MSENKKKNTNNANLEEKMKIRNAEITMSAVSKKQYPSEGVPEIALAGRSNVGKSSLINGLLNKRNFARTSSTPGKTRTINFYLINNEFYFVDLPGYGYAKVSKTEKEKWGGIMQQYLESREELCSILLLVDVRHEPTEDDKLMYEWIKFFGYDCIVVATKADKISRGQYQKHVSIIRKKLQMDSNDKVILTSASKKIGFSQLWDSIVESYEEHGYEINYEKTTE